MTFGATFLTFGATFFLGAAFLGAAFLATTFFLGAADFPTLYEALTLVKVPSITPLARAVRKAAYIK